MKLDTFLVDVSLVFDNDIGNVEVSAEEILEELFHIVYQQGVN